MNGWLTYPEELGFSPVVEIRILFVGLNTLTMKPTFAALLLLLVLVNLYPVIPISASSATLTIAPASAVLPRVDMGEGSMCFEVALRVANVQNLKELHIDFSYNPSIVQLVRGKFDEGFFLKCGGGTGDEFDFLLAIPYTGSGVMARYVFRMVGSGNTTVSLSDTHLIDASGAPILVTAQPCSVRILRVGDYSYFVHMAEARLSDLQEDYAALDTQYTAKSQDYDELQSQYDDLSNAYNILDTSYDELETTYQGLSDSFDELQADEATLENELRNTRNMLLIAVAAIIVLAIIIYQKVLRK